MIIIDDIDYSGIILYTLLQRISIYKFMSEIYLLIDGIIYCQRTLQIHQGAKYLTHIEIRISSCKSNESEYLGFGLPAMCSDESSHNTTHDLLLECILLFLFIPSSDIALRFIGISECGLRSMLTCSGSPSKDRK